MCVTVYVMFSLYQTAQKGSAERIKFAVWDNLSHRHNDIQDDCAWVKAIELK